MERASHALAVYVVTSLVATWPLVRGLGRDVPWDLGDSILNMWILSWDCEQIRRMLTGDLSRIATFFDANIFHPVPLALAYSEHLIPQAIQIFPVYLISRNPILCYNLLFLSTFVLSGLGMYLLVRELTGNGRAAFVAGLLFAFDPYRLPQSGHLQVLSSQWMPFVLYGLLRYFHTRRLLPLAGAALALTAQNLSSLYYLLFFAPCAVAFALWQVARLGLWRDRRTWAALSGAGLLVALLTAPFLLPYIALRDEGLAARSLTEAVRFSADVYSYATASGEQQLWGPLTQVIPKPEGELFPGVVAVLLALVGIAFGGRLAARSVMPDATSPEGRLSAESRGPAPWTAMRPPTRILYALRGVGGRSVAVQSARSAPRDTANQSRALRDIKGRARDWLAWFLVAVALGHGAAAIATLLLRRITLDLGPLAVRMSNINQLLLRAGVAFVLLLVVSPAARARTRAFLRDRGFFVVTLLAAVWLSLGPMPQSLGRPIEIAAPYRLLFDYVPGFDGVRVPARFAMIVALALAALAGYGAAVLSRTRFGRVALIAASVIAVLEATRMPFIVNSMFPLRDFNAPEARVYRPARAPALYHELAKQPADTVVLELPLGPPDFDLRAMYYSTVHWWPVVNGYSGFYPPHYGSLAAALSEIPRHPDISLQALRSTGATHLVLHEAAYRDDEGTATAAVLLAAGAVELFRNGPDVLFLFPH
ncbi:MAG: hypothetical protein ACRD3C_20795 [Vicinamibacterales bacterium]